MALLRCNTDTPPRRNATTFYDHIITSTGLRISIDEIDQILCSSEGTDRSTEYKIDQLRFLRFHGDGAGGVKYEVEAYDGEFEFPIVSSVSTTLADAYYNVSINMSDDHQMQIKQDLQCMHSVQAENDDYQVAVDQFALWYLLCLAPVPNRLEERYQDSVESSLVKFGRALKVPVAFVTLRRLYQEVDKMLLYCERLYTFDNKDSDMFNLMQRANYAANNEARVRVEELFPAEFDKPRWQAFNTELLYKQVLIASMVCCMSETWRPRRICNHNRGNQ